MTVRVYYLDTEIVNGTEKVLGESIIKNAILEVEGKQRKLTMDTTTTQHSALKAVATSSRSATPEEAARLQALDFTPPTKSLDQEVAELKTRITTLENAKVV